MQAANLNDKILIIKARLGDKEAFATIYDKYVTKLYRFAYYKTGNRELAEDLVSQTFLKSWEMILNGGHIRALQALLYQMLRNLIADHYRSKQSTELPLEYDIAADNNTDDRIHATIDRELVKKAIDRVTNQDYREIIILRYIEELSITEIAKILDTTKGNIATMSHRALTELKKILKDYS